MQTGGRAVSLLTNEDIVRSCHSRNVTEHDSRRLVNEAQNNACFTSPNVHTNYQLPLCNLQASKH